VWDDIHPERQNEHVAAFPVELPRRLIRMYSFHGETVLDPFMGSGTTARAAALEGRHSIGYEINPDFEALIREKLGISGGSSSDEPLGIELTIEERRGRGTEAR
jgi:site-specific DNA-methyltransferase (adenine-specific)